MINFIKSIKYYEVVGGIIMKKIIALLLAMAILLPLPLQLAAVGLLLVRYLIVLLEVRRIARRLGEKRMLRLYPLYDLFSPLWVLLRSLLMLRKDERVWR